MSDDPRDIIVTGTNISGVKAVGSEAVTLDRAAIVATGVSSVADAVRTLPQVRNLGDFREGGTVGNGSGNTQQGNAINLRGLGAQATLTLVDGHRVVATGAGYNFTEANQVPIAALARIEVIADGASAIYGSDAVAGVVNFVLRRDFDGVEASYRVTNQNGGFEMSPSLTFGKTWDSLGGLGRGNIIVAYEYTKRDAYLSAKNRFLRQDLRPFGGPDNRLNGTTVQSAGPANIYVPTGGPQNPDLPRAGANTYYGLPQGPNVGLTPADLLLNQPNLADSSYYTDYTGRLNRHQVSVFANQELGSWLEAFVQGTYTHRRTFSRAQDQTVQNVTLSPFLYDAAGNVTATPNPYYISGIPGVTPGAALNVQYSALKDLGGSNFDNTVETYSITGGVKVRLPFEWRGEAYYTYGRDTACNSCQLGGQNVNATALQYQINLGNINPLSSLPLSPAQTALYTGNNLQESGNGIDDLVVKFDGPLFALPGGTVRAAFGGERNKQYNFNINGSNRGNDNAFGYDTTEANSRISRTVWSAFGELYVPLVGEEMNVPLVRSLIVDGAVRYDHYSDFGGTTNPKIGMTWQVNDALSFRGSWGTSFRAPSLTDTNLFAFSAVVGFPVPNSDPRITNGFLNIPGIAELANAAVLFGSNPNLGPETATNWSVGGNLKLGDFTADVSYYNIEYSNRILAPDVLGNFFAGGAPGYSGYGAFVVPINNPGTCSNGTLSSYDPLLQGFLGRTLLFGALPDPCSVNVVLDGRSTNLAATKQDGLDATLDYRHEYGDVTVNASVAVNWTLSNKEQVYAGGPFVDRLGLYSTPIEWRGRGAIGAMWRGFSTNLFINYVGSYKNNLAVDELGDTLPEAPRIKPWTTFDLTLGYSGDLADIPGSPFKGLRVSATVFNLFDRDPPIAVTSRGAFNASYSNPFGRTATMQVTLNF